MSEKISLDSSASTYEKTIILTHVWLIAIWLWR